jgi:hypothetical protein
MLPSPRLSQTLIQSTACSFQCMTFRRAWSPQNKLSARILTTSELMLLQ